MTPWEAILDFDDWYRPHALRRLEASGILDADPDMMWLLKPGATQHLLRAPGIGRGVASFVKRALERHDMRLGDFGPWVSGSAPIVFSLKSSGSGTREAPADKSIPLHTTPDAQATVSVRKRGKTRG